MGTNVKISKFACVYGAKFLTIGNNVRIDDFTIISINSESFLGDYVHLGNSVSILSTLGFEIGDFAGISPGARIFGNNDDFTSGSLMHPTVPSEFRSVEMSRIMLGKYSQIGANSILLPSARLGQGAILGALSLLKEGIDEWTIYAGSPAKKIGLRNRVTQTPK